MGKQADLPLFTDKFHQHAGEDQEPADQAEGDEHGVATVGSGITIGEGAVIGPKAMVRNNVEGGEEQW